MVAVGCGADRGGVVWTGVGVVEMTGVWEGEGEG